MERWYALTIALRSVCWISGIATMVLATFEVWCDGRGEFERLVEHLHELYHDHCNLERMVGWVQGRGEIAPVLFAAGLVLVGGSRRLGALLTNVLLVVGGWALGKRFRVSVTPRYMIVHRWWWRDLKFERIGDNPQVRLTSAEEYFSSLAPRELEMRKFLIRRITNPPAVVEIVNRLRRYKLLMARHEDVAEAIVVKITEAAMDTKPIGVFRRSGGTDTVSI